MRKPIALSLAVFLYLFITAQNFTYTRYDIKDGLAGSHVYAAVQDKEGFMWFATETGLSRFDGLHFKNFTTEEGLPDNEILNLFCDSKGRLWIMPFRKTICYYYKGQLHTQQNDSVLKKIRLTGNIFFMTEARDGSFAFAEAYKIHVLKGSSVQVFDRDGEYVSALGCDNNGIVHIVTSSGLYQLQSGKMIIAVGSAIGYGIGEITLAKNFYTTWDNGQIIVRSYNNNDRKIVDSSVNHMSFSVLSDTFFTVNTRNGTTIYNYNNLDHHEHHLPGKTIGAVYKDNEQNLWFCTPREGIYKLNSPFIAGQSFSSKDGKRLSVHSIIKYKDQLWVGADDGYLFTFQTTTGASHIEPYTLDEAGLPRNNTRALLQNKQGDLMIGLEMDIRNMNTGRFIRNGSLKDIAYAYGNYIIYISSSGVWVVDPKTLLGVDTIWWDPLESTCRHASLSIL